MNDLNTIQRQFYPLPATAEFSGISKSTVLRYEKAGLFPKRKRLGPGRVGWDIRELQAWVDAREEACLPPVDDILQELEFNTLGADSGIEAVEVCLLRLALHANSVDPLRQESLRQGAKQVLEDEGATIIRELAWGNGIRYETVEKVAGEREGKPNPALIGRESWTGSKLDI